MRKILLTVVAAISLCWGVPVLAAEKIDSFDVTAQVNADASVSFTERIEYDFGATERHGIYRFIPIKYSGRAGNYNLRVSDFSVADENGGGYNFTVSYPGDNVEIKVGDADITVSGKRVYIIGYTVRRAVGYFDEYDELYWNATGNEWQIPIANARVKIILPQEVKGADLRASCYYGSYGAAEKCDATEVAGTIAARSPGGVFSAANLAAGEGLTAALGFPKGIVHEPTAGEKIWETIKDNGVVCAPILAFIVMFYLWFTRGRDARGRGVVVAQFDAPDKISPAEVGLLADERVDKRDLSAEIIWLAVHGYLKINRLEGQGMFKSTDYELTRLKGADTPPGFGALALTEYQEKLLTAFFETGSIIKLSSLKEKFYKDWQTAAHLVYASAVAHGYYKHSPRAVRAAYVSGAGAVGFLGYALTSAAYHGPIHIVSWVVTGLVVAVFGIFMPALTRKGSLAKEHILGLKTYLSVAEKDRINFHNAPEKNPEQFEKFLPFAMALGVEKAWAKQFEGIYNQQPSWYNDNTHGMFTAMMLANSMGDFRSHAQSALAAMPAAKGGSGSMGGGFSGGGFGGGGGGSW